MRSMIPVKFCLVIIAINIGCYGDAAIRVSGVVLGDNGKPIANANVKLEPDPQMYPNALPATDQTDDEGKFSVLVTLPPKGKGSSVLFVNAEGYEQTKKRFENEIHANEVIRLNSKDAKEDHE